MLSSIMIIFIAILTDFPSSSQYYNLPKFCPDANWNSMGTVYPNRSNELNRPRNIFVDIEDTVYVSYDETGLVVVWLYGIQNPSRLYNSTLLVDDESGMSSLFSQLINYIIGIVSKLLEGWTFWSWGSNEPSDESMIPLNTSNSLFVTSNESIYIGDGHNKRIVNWENKTYFTAIGLDSYSPCYGLFVDFNSTLYCSSRGSHKVIKKMHPYETNQWTITAGTGSSGSTSEKLNSPFGIFVTNNFDLYVSDWGNNRIQLFKYEDLNGSTVLDNQVLIDGHLLNHPTSLILDADDNLYIVDSENHRIVFASLDQQVYKCLIGCSGEPSSEHDHLKFPTSISFDSSGSILVSDTNNNRVMKFQYQSSSCKTIITSTTSENLISTENTIFTTKLQTVTTTSEDTSVSSDYFVPNDCSDSNFIGNHCDIPASPCDLLNSCSDRDSCINDPTQPHGYTCKIKPVNPCQSNPCINNGTCVQLNETNFRCNCVEHRIGARCEFWIDYCQNIVCFNQGRCRSVPPSYVCDCISSSFSGQHCEKVANNILIRRYISSTLGYIGITALCSVAAFIVIMDVLKYGFGIDPVRSERELARRRINRNR